MNDQKTCHLLKSHWFIDILSSTEVSLQFSFHLAGFIAEMAIVVDSEVR